MEMLEQERGEVDSVSETRTAVIIGTADDVLGPLVEKAGYEVVGVCDSGVNGEHLLELLRPDVVVVEQDLRGEPGWFALPTLRAASPTTRVLLVVTDDWVPHDMGATGAFAVVTMSRLGELVTELDSLDDWIRDEEANPLPLGERRLGRDRRHDQDWNQVGWERREAPRRTAS